MVAQFTNAISADRLINRVRDSFVNIEDQMNVNQRTSGGKQSISLSDCLMSGFALFSLKYPSLLQFDKDRLIDSSHMLNLRTRQF